MNAASNATDKTKVAVIGAGIVGLMTAMEIQRTGRQVDETGKVVVVVIAPA